MPLQRSQGQRRPAVWRVDELPRLPATAGAAPDRDPSTGRFAKGNSASRHRKLKSVARALVGLNPAVCDPWLRPYVTLAAGEAQRILDELPARGAAIDGLAIDCATAQAVYRGLLALGAQGDREALAEARQWLREHRTTLIALEGLAREMGASRRPGDDFAALVAQVQATEASAAKGGPS